MTKTLKRQIDSSILMSDGHFGISLHLWERMPTGCNAMLIEVINKDGTKFCKGVKLPHQLYLEDLKEMSLNGELDVIITPVYTEVKSFNIFKND